MLYLVLKKVTEEFSNLSQKYWQSQADRHSLTKKEWKGECLIVVSLFYNY